MTSGCCPGWSDPFWPRPRALVGICRPARGSAPGATGADAKVSTAKPNPNEVNPTDGVICVYTYDSDDERDVMRVREELRALGFTNKIPYKTDEATLSGKYRRHGERKISKYYC